MSVLLMDRGPSNSDDNRMTIHDAAVSTKPLHLRRADRVTGVPIAL